MLDVLMPLAAAHGHLRIHDDVEREGHVVSGEGLAVVPQYASV
jgi:hypothetical protein